MHRRKFLRGALSGAAAVLLSAPFVSSPVDAHHGWGWATDEEFELTGTIVGVRLGNPHGELTVDVAGEDWVVEIGQPWRNQQAGLTEEKLANGTEVVAHGHRSANPDAKLMKAEWLTIGGVKHDLYPDRSS